MRRGVGLLALGLGLAATPADAQVVRAEPGGTRVAVAVLGDVGSGLDARARAATPALAELGAWATPVCDAGASGFVVVAPPARWREAVGAIGLEEPEEPKPPTPASAPEPRSPEAAFDSLFAAARGAGGACDAPGGRGDVVYAVVGPVDRDSASTFAARVVAGLSAPPRLPGVPAGGGAPARRLVARTPTVTTWIGLSYPVAAETGPETARLLGDWIASRLGVEKTGAGLLRASATLERSRTGDRLLLRLLADPDAADALEQAAREAVARAAVWPVPDAEFVEVVRAYRGRRLVSLRWPEARAAALARAQLVGAEPLDVAAAIDALTPAALRAAADALGPPSVAVLGPAPRR